ncbi:ROK family protein [Cetobacterium sp. 2A]|uniref:ROK family protein n=1 Tax=unclassified Cetobacterium TaxID=2630983 RepID=UPI00163C0BBE|nr:ROK family protein [Cetobacterium sp. 2A]MBC2855565.1 ROK family protein [Cetobacterium sp. 2A]
MNIVAIDIGGTSIKYGVVNENGEILKTDSEDTDAEKGVEQLLEKIYFIVEKYLFNDKIKGIAVSATGQIDAMKGKVVGGTELIPGWIGTNLVDILQKKYSLPVVLENDVNCAALGEFWLGAAKNSDNFICLTVGTGIGGGIVLNGELFRGEGFVAGEFGHIQIEKGGKNCGCGKKGCYQQYASTTALLELIKEKTGETLNGKEFFSNVTSIGGIYESILEKWCDYLTDGLSTLVYIFNPRLIVIGGGISIQRDLLETYINRSLKEKIGKNYNEILKIKMADRGNDAGLLGATYLLLQKII